MENFSLLLAVSYCSIMPSQQLSLESYQCHLSSPEQPSCTLATAECVSIILLHALQLSCIFSSTLWLHTLPSTQDSLCLSVPAVDVSQEHFLMNTEVSKEQKHSRGCRWNSRDLSSVRNTFCYLASHSSTFHCSWEGTGAPQQCCCSQACWRYCWTFPRNLSLHVVKTIYSLLFGLMLQGPWQLVRFSCWI